MPTLSDITVAVLAGGLGTRLRSVVSVRPKVLARVLGRPFLTYLLDQLAAAGTREVVLCTGYMSDMVEEILGNRYKTLRLVYSKEEEPLGTGGAIRHALEYFPSDLVLIMNGDSFVNTDLIVYLHWFFEMERDASLLLVKVPDTNRFGRVITGENGLIIGFEEKGTYFGPGWINAGVYILKKKLLESIPPGKPFSLERELFPPLAEKRLYGYQSGGEFIDIGTPESYGQAKNFFSKKAGKAYED
jgi:NDP-sugar pyrophosphorylase family protein